ncbi:MAG: DUF928 domain-containing protein [Symploca sp. SIO1C4]|uniref:DUF928 domain-containing protein n=1 Tax=Symploca sp. SIO1C4 TaxID=2607765 RepID=A0A6B3NL28_9CYAN|nr:DUF928 domain-containing protein [Symploca sp. SIO1C4]
MDIPQSSFKLVLTLALTLASLLTNSTSIAAENTEPESFELTEALALPEAPPTGSPEDGSSMGGTREPALDTACKKTNNPLVSLLAANEENDHTISRRDFTSSPYPSFWFHIPYVSQEVSYIEFALQDPQLSKTIYRTAVKLTDKPGIIQINLPQQEQYSLEVEKDYYWDFIVYCAPNQPHQTEQPDVVLQGWIRRVAVNAPLKNQLESVKPQEYIAYIDNDLLYDAVTNLAALRLANPENPQLHNDWTKLLSLLGWEELASEPLVDSIQLFPEEQATTNFLSK